MRSYLGGFSVLAQQVFAWENVAEFWRGLPMRDIQGSLSFLVFKLWLCPAFTTALPMSLCSVTCKVSLTYDSRRNSEKSEIWVLICCRFALFSALQLHFWIWSVSIKHLMVLKYWMKWKNSISLTSFFRKAHFFKGAFQTQVTNLSTQYLVD